MPIDEMTSDDRDSLTAYRTVAIVAIAMAVIGDETRLACRFNDGLETTAAIWLRPRSWRMAPHAGFFAKAAHGLPDLAEDQQHQADQRADHRGQDTQLRFDERQARVITRDLFGRLPRILFIWVHERLIERA